MNVILVMVVMAGLLGAGDWPRFRGPNGSGVTEAAGLPVEFGPAKHVAWKAAVPFARSSPIVAAGRVYVTASEGEKLVTLAFDEATGKALWRGEVKRARTQKIFRMNDPASPTPVADAKGVVAFFPDFGMVAYGVDGIERWRVPMGPFENFYGMSSSPILSGDSVILLCDQARGSFVMAVDRATGKTKWKRMRPEHNVGWAVPIVYQDQLITVGTARVDGYHLSTGEPRWWMAAASQGSMGSPVIHEGKLIVTMLGDDQPMFPSFEATAATVDKDKDGRMSAEESKSTDWTEHFGWVDANNDGFVVKAEWEVARNYGVGEYGAMAIPLDGRGRLEPSAISWRFKRNLPYVPSPVLYGGVFYMAKTGGIVTSLDPADGKMLKQGRSKDAPGEYYASPVAADGKVYLVSEEGKVTVLKAGAQWEVLAVNDLGEESTATPAISGGRLFVRTRGTLYAFGGK